MDGRNLDGLSKPLMRRWVHDLTYTVPPSQSAEVWIPGFIVVYSLIWIGGIVPVDGTVYCNRYLCKLRLPDSLRLASKTLVGRSAGH